MHKSKILLILGAALTIAACGNNGHSNRNNNAANANTNPTGNTQDKLSYMAYIQKMIADKTSDDTEPVDVEMVQVEQADDTEAMDVM